MNPVTAICDRLAVWWRGGIRIRVVKGVPAPRGVVFGGLKGLSGDEALQFVLELDPEAPGTVHILRDSLGLYQVKVTGALADDYFAQRVRNVLGTL
jgi:hypothetical protein